MVVNVGSRKNAKYKAYRVSRTHPCEVNSDRDVDLTPPKAEAPAGTEQVDFHQQTTNNALRDEHVNIRLVCARCGQPVDCRTGLEERKRAAPSPISPMAARATMARP